MGAGKEQPKRLRVGEGYISGYLSILFAMVALGAALTLIFPQYLTTAEFREYYSQESLKYLLVTCMLTAFCFAFSSFILSGRSRLGLTGVIVGSFAILAGGNFQQSEEVSQSILNVSVDWLLIDIIILSIIFIPLELFLPQRRDQTKFHEEWKTDAVYFAVSHLLVQYVAILVQLPAETLFRNVGLQPVQEAVQSLPFLAQLFLAMLFADLFQYAAHRAFHANRTLWRFHAVHHSISTIDWVAGSRLHLVDILATRAFSYLPLYVLGLPIEVFYTYVAVVAIQAVAAHANIRISFGPIRYLLVTPQYHHWHHSDDPEFYDKNFAIHFPFIDKIFGTYHLPKDAWPESVGLKDQQFPTGYVRQFLYPFKKR